jgi:hypothetical protein
MKWANRKEKHYFCGMLCARRFFCLLLLVVCQALPARSSNPFDLQFRLPEAPETGVNGLPGNPFDVVAHREPGAAKALLEALPEDRKPVFSLPTGNTVSERSLFFILLSVLAFLAFTVAANRSAALKAWSSLLNDNALAIAQRESAGQAGNTPYYLLYGNFLLNASLFLFLIVQSQAGDRYNNFGFLGFCFLFVAAVFLTKHLLLRLVGWLLPVEQDLLRYNFLIIAFNCVLGLFLLPFNLVIPFLLKYKDFLVFWVIGLAILFYGYRALRALSVGAKFLAGNQFHFLLYLCTVEIAPAAILVKLVLLQTR